MIQNSYDEEIKLFNRCFEINQSLESEDVKRFQEIINKANNFEEIRKCHFESCGLPFEKSEFYIIIQKNIQNLLMMIKNNNPEDEINKEILNKAKTLVNTNRDYLTPSFLVLTTIYVLVVISSVYELTWYLMCHLPYQHEKRLKTTYVTYLKYEMASLLICQI